MLHLGLSRRWFTPILVLVALCLGSLAGTGCGGPRWVVVRQAAPNPLHGQSQFVIEAVTYPNLLIGDKPEAAWLSEKKEDARQSFEGDKTETAKNLIEQLIARAGSRGIQVIPWSGAPGAFNLRPAITFFEPGNYNGFVNTATTVQISVQVLSAQGQIIDEVVFRSDVPATLYNPTSGGRMQLAGKDLGGQIANYLIWRSLGG